MTPPRPAAATARRALLLAGAVLAAPALTGCGTGAAASLDASRTPTASSAAPTIRTEALDVAPFPPSNAAWYSAAVLAARRPFARWEQDRDRVVLVTWPAACSRVPVAIAFPRDGATITAVLGAAPRRAGSSACRPGHVLTSTFEASRVLRRDRPTPVLVDGARLVLPPAPPLVLAPPEGDVVRGGATRSLHRVAGPLPQYSVPASPWTLGAAASAGSRSVVVVWEGGTCGPNAADVVVQETASTVVVDVVEAPPPVVPAAPSRRFEFCAGVGQAFSTTVRLDRPLGNRRLLQHRFGERPADQDAY